MRNPVALQRERYGARVAAVRLAVARCQPEQKTARRRAAGNVYDVEDISLARPLIGGPDGLQAAAGNDDDVVLPSGRGRRWLRRLRHDHGQRWEANTLQLVFVEAVTFQNDVRRGGGRKVASPVSGKNGGPEMLARTVGVELRAVAPCGERAILPIQANVVIPRSPDASLHAGRGAALDAHAALPEIALAAVPDRGAEIVSQSDCQIHRSRTSLGGGG